MKYPSLEEFLQTPYPDHAHVRYKSIVSYMRKGRRVIDDVVVKALTRANTVNRKRRSNGVPLEHYSRTGLYLEFDEHCREMARKYDYDGVYVELVLNEFLQSALIRYGYKRVNIRALGNYSEHNYWYSVRDER